MKRAALSLIELVVVIAIMATSLGLLLPAVMRVRAASTRSACSNKMRQIGLALHNYHGAHGALPSGTGPAAPGSKYPYLNWHACLLPQLDLAHLWQAIDSAYREDRDFRNIPPHSHRGTIVAAFVCDADSRAFQLSDRFGQLRVAFTSYLGVSGTNSEERDGILYMSSQTRFLDILDGLENTIVVGERPPSADQRYGWWYAGQGQRLNGQRDGSLDATLGIAEFNRSQHPNDLRCFGGPYRFGPGRDSNQCDAFHYWSHHPGGANFVFADGSVRFVSYTQVLALPALATRAGGEPAMIPD